MNTECFRVLPGQDLAKTIERYCAERQITAAAVVACAGCQMCIRDSALRGRCVNRFTNEPVLNYYSLFLRQIQQKTVQFAPFFFHRGSDLFR